MRAEILNLGGQFNLDNFAKIIRQANEKLSAQKLTDLGVFVTGSEYETRESSPMSNLRIKSKLKNRSDKNLRYVKNYFRQKLKKTLGL